MDHIPSELYMDDIPTDVGLDIPFSPRTVPPWNFSPRAESPMGTPPSTPRLPHTPPASGRATLLSPSQQNAIQQSLIEVMNEFNQNILGLSNLVADLPNRLRIGEEHLRKCGFDELAQLRPRGSTTQSSGWESTAGQNGVGLSLRPTGGDGATGRVDFGDCASEGSASDDGSVASASQTHTQFDRSISPFSSHHVVEVGDLQNAAVPKREVSGTSIPIPSLQVRSKTFRTALALTAALPFQWAPLLVRPKEMRNMAWDIPKITQRTEYEIAMGAVILTNTVYMGIELQYAGENSGADLDPSHLISMVFVVIYLLDLLARLRCEGFSFFNGREMKWNFMDTIVVVAAMADQILNFCNVNGVLQSVVVLRVLRLLRLVRIFHLGRLLKQFKEFRILMYSLQRASGALFWTLVLHLLNVYIFSVAVAQGSVDSCGAGNSHSSSCAAFGKLSDVILNMYKTLFWGVLWGDLFDLIGAFGSVYQGIFLFYIAFTITIVFNLATGIVLDIVHETVRRERDVVIDNIIADKVEYVQMMQTIFEELDVDGSGGICMDELVYATKNVRMSAWLESLGLDLSDVEDIFHFIDRDRTGTIDITEFVLGCMRLRGGAKTVDVMKLQFRSQWLMNNLDSLHNKIDHIVDTGAHASSLASLRQPSKRALTNQSFVMEPQLQKEKLRLREEDFQNWCVIDATEMRAMALRDLKSTMRFAKIQCATHNWLDSDKGTSLPPGQVNLYHLNYHCISPRTVPEGVRLHGLKWGAYRNGQRIIQRYRNGTPPTILASGVVLGVSTEGIVHVRVVDGRFFSGAVDDREQCVMIDEVDIGVPSKVEKPVSLSWKELAFPVAIKPRWFCSHWWGEPIADFVACCDRHATLRGLQNEQASYWVCAYANRQHDLASDISKDPDESSFRKAMRVAEGTLLLLDGLATPFRRIWCDFEVYHTICDEKPLDIVAVRNVDGKHEHEPQLLTQGLSRGETSYDKLHREENFPLSLLVVGLKSHLEDGDASVPADKDAILRSMARNKITKQEGDADRLAMALKRANAKLHSYLAMAAWPQALKKGRVDNFDQAGTLSLPCVLSQNDSMETMCMSFAHMDEMTDVAMEHVAAGIPPNIFRLQLSFEGCSSITDRGVIALANKLPSSLEVLFLNFVGCQHITSFALNKLGQHLAPSLRELRLDFAHCEGLDSDGVKILADRLPGSLKRFAATFQGTEVDRNFQSAKDLQRFCRPKHSNPFSHTSSVKSRSSSRNSSRRSV